VTQCCFKWALLRFIGMILWYGWQIDIAIIYQSDVFEGEAQTNNDPEILKGGQKSKIIL